MDAETRKLLRRLVELQPPELWGVEQSEEYLEIVAAAEKKLTEGVSQSDD